MGTVTEEFVPTPPLDSQLSCSHLIGKPAPVLLLEVALSSSPTCWLWVSDSGTPQGSDMKLSWSTLRINPRKTATHWRVVESCCESTGSLTS